MTAALSPPPPVRIELIELRLLRLPLVHHFETSFGRITEREFVLVKLAGDGAVAWGESVAESEPFYSSETTETVWHIVERFLAPALLLHSFEHPREVFDAMAFVRGHRMAKAALEMAAWALFATSRGEPLSRLLGGTRTSIPSGVSIGIQDSLDELVERVGRERAAGYQRVKIKIKPGWDVAAVERVREVHGSIPLMVDANAAYRPADGDHLAELDRFDLTMIEQPLDYDDVRQHAVLQGRLRTRVCLDESITSPARAEEAIALRACGVINIKPGRLGGFSQSIRVHDLARAAGLPVWHGGMLESGIGRAHNIHLASLANFSLPGDIAASRRYFAPDLIEPGIDVAADGTVAVPTGAGLGVNIDEERIARATLRVATVRRS